VVAVSQLIGQGDDAPACIAADVTEGVPSKGMPSESDTAHSLVNDDITTAVICDPKPGRRANHARAFGKVGAEVTAVDLAGDTDERVFTVLSLDPDATEARKCTALGTRTLADMGQIEWELQMRAQGGEPDRSKRSVLGRRQAKSGKWRARLASRSSVILCSRPCASRRARRAGVAVHTSS
jgi:hypothetical protein